MARPRAYDQNEAIKGATDIFWRQGFKATNLPDLLKSMNMTRGSFYLAFGTKQRVYELCLDYYDQKVLENVVSGLDTCDREQVWDCIAPLFESTAAERRGCFICNAMVELGPENRDVAERTKKMADRLRAAIERVLTRHKDQLKIANATECADLILQLYFGHQAMGRASEQHAGWEDVLKKLVGDRSTTDDLTE